MDSFLNVSLSASSLATHPFTPFLPQHTNSSQVRKSVSTVDNNDDDDDDDDDNVNDGDNDNDNEVIKSVSTV